jgi:virginiamycin B lyase
MNTLRILLACAAVAMLGFPAVAGTFTGVIKTVDGELMHGVLVRVSSENSHISEGVYSDAEGKFALDTVLSGDLAVRLRTPYFRDVSLDIELSPDGTEHRQLSMTPMETDAEISDSLPAGYHYGSLPFETGDDAVFNRYQFQRDCLSCHQLGNEMTRQPRTPKSWHQTIIRMHRYMGGKFDQELRERRSVILSTGFNGKPITVRPQFPIDAKISDAKVTEYRLDRGNPHDTIIHPETGMMYSADQGYSHVAVTDPVSGVTEYISQYGERNKFYVPGTNKKEVETFAERTRNSPHSLALGLDGNYYVTNSGSNTIGVFDPRTNLWEPSYVIGHGINYPHTIRVDKKGIAWYTISGAEHLGRTDPKTGESIVIPLGDAVAGGVSYGTWPYGIDIHPIDGSIWYSRLFADEVGRIDPDTLEVTRFDSPMRGPRRMHFDASGVLWVTGYSEGTLAAITPSTKDGKVSIKSKVYDMPEFSEGFRPAPYALGVHPQTQEVWVNENMTDRFYRFIPREERWVVYPIPLRGTYTRDFDFSPDGKVCASNNPAPLASLEGATSEILCIEINDRDTVANL